jgi:hypothetical protein
MNHAKLKNYAPQARREFIQAMTDRAAFYGLTATTTEPIVENGDVAVIGGRSYPIAIARKRKELEVRIKRHGFAQTMEAIAYTWFNRLVAIRFMELHGYLDHGYRVLSHPDGKPTPEILQYAEYVDLPTLKRESVIDLKLDGNKEAELYRLLLTAQCNALNWAMPFLFERIDDETELLLPDNLLHSDSLIRKLVSNLDAEDCETVEVLGWLYQFYIAEKKDMVMARKSAVPTDDIPAVTQLFTPHWIVRYLVENSLGRLWMQNRPQSKLRDHMPYYIEGEAETDFLKITKPEEIRLCDPAVGSGHMLTYAFDLLTLIYEEEGYAPSAIPSLILRHNLYGLEICPRAAQLAELALVFKAREKSRRFFQPEHLVRPHIIELRDVRFAEDELSDYIDALGLGDLFNQPMLRLLHQFEEAKNFGSLIQPCLDERAIANARRAIEAKDLGGQLFLRETHLKVLRVLEQAEALTQRYHVVVANPPYMGWQGMNSRLAAFVTEQYPDGKADLMTCFVERAHSMCAELGYIAAINLPSWMFLKSFEAFRAWLLRKNGIVSLLHNGRGVFGADFGTVAFVLRKSSRFGPGVYGRLFEKESSVDSEETKLTRFFDRSKGWNQVNQTVFAAIPGSPIAYWISPRLAESFSEHAPLSSAAIARKGLVTAANESFVRFWHEVDNQKVGFGHPSRESAKSSSRKWFSYAKGGPYRKWYGNLEAIVNWENDGFLIQTTKHPTDDRVRATNFNLDSIFKPAVCWTVVTISNTSFRVHGPGYVFDAAAGLCQPRPQTDLFSILGMLNSRVAQNLLALINPTINLHPGYLEKLPFPEAVDVVPIVSACVAIARADWDNFETSWDFRDQPLLRPGLKGATLEASWRNWEAQSTAAIRRMQELETENNRLFIAAYGLDGELQPEVPEEQITLARADAHRDMAAFLSYAIGCMMGRYSINNPGLILANAGDTLENYWNKVQSGAGVPPAIPELKTGKMPEPLYSLEITGKMPEPLFSLEITGKLAEPLYSSEITGRMPVPLFVPDVDGIIPVLNGEWFEDDIVARTHDFLRATFGEATLRENLSFIEESLGKELRSYLLTDFYKDHLQTYKKRPIYWLFSSGKQRAFQCLVYLHRYQEGTLARMRTEYVIPLQGQIASRIEQLEGDKANATSTSYRKKIQKEQDDLKKQQVELSTFEEKLKHYADMRINIDLDDGVKVNYAKFSDLLAESKAITGGKEDE